LVYDQYTAELTKIGDQKTALLKEYAEQWGTISDEQASSLIKRSLSLDGRVHRIDRSGPSVPLTPRENMRIRNATAQVNE
jgi:hypothetical protein